MKRQQNCGQFHKLGLKPAELTKQVLNIETWELILKFSTYGQPDS